MGEDLLFPLDQIDKENIDHCGRCGLCLAVCPTYRDTGLETFSPRGRAQMIRAALQGDIAAGDNLRQHAYQCMDCCACETACPSGVRVAHAVIAMRAQVEKERKDSLLKNVVLRQLLPHPDRLELATTPLWLYQRLGLQKLVNGTGLADRLPGPMSIMARLLPPLSSRPLHQTVTEITEARGEARQEVSFFLGCAMSFVFPQASKATLHVLSVNGCRVLTPKGQVCCGAPHLAEGDIEGLKAVARHNIDLFRGEGIIVTDCASCGSMLKDYAALLVNDAEYGERAAAFATRIRDVSEFLTSIEMNNRLGEIKRRVTYHDPCHLRHAQGISVEPRKLLQAVPGLEFVAMPEPDWCCGSAGIYNLTHMERGMRILDRTMDNIAATGAEEMLTGNPGCLLQMRLGAQKRRMPLKVRHPVELLSEAYRVRNDE